MAEHVVSIRSGDTSRSARIEDDGGATVDGTRFTIVQAPAAGEMVATDGERVERLFVSAVGDAIWVFHDGITYELTVDEPGAAVRRQHSGSLSAPMPATVVSVHARPGDAVTRGTTLIVLEAMKMELPVRAPGDGVVSAVHCAPGDLVQPGTPLIELQ
jgi:acetyl/propionyl-CoA carboxylase alpha subunit